ncbi:MAG: 50S ribosomal protein L11 methyltransferase [Anaerolineales bacterium]|nr:50S ribosomal protein L11 methyltransferase [Anaerolineales bacterium]
MTDASWVEVSLIVDGELAEATAEVLARFLPDGVVIESTAVTAEADDSEGHAVGPLRVFGYLPVDDRLEETRQRLQEALWYLGRIRPLPEAQFRPIQHINWAEAWKEHYHPIPVGRRLMIVPAWLEVETQDRLPIRIDPGMAFGTGTHPTTQLCLELIEEILQPGEIHKQALDVIDLGCGTAILSIAALKLGARRALGVDIDADAIQAARENAQANGTAEHLELGLGSLAEIRAGQFSLQQADVVLANILAPVLTRLLDEGLEDILTPHGYLILSGILEEQAQDIIAAAQRRSLRLTEQRQSGDWIALCFQRS